LINFKPTAHINLITEFPGKHCNNIESRPNFNYLHLELENAVAAGTIFVGSEVNILTHTL
jgi:hypothetical protein